jgi:hypothetical protein
MTESFLSETMQARRQLNDILKVLKGKKYCKPELYMKILGEGGAGMVLQL